MYSPHEAQQALKALGAEIRLARKRRCWTLSELASKMKVSSPTLINLEKGEPTVSTGILFSALWILGILGFEKTVTSLVHPEDKMGFEMLNRRLPKRVRHSRKGLDNDF